MKLFASVITGFLILLAVSGSVMAQEQQACRPIFGGGPSCVQQGDLSLDKKIHNPQTNQFVDTIDTDITPGQTIRFQVTVRNTGSRTIENIVVTDIFPQHITFTRGPGQFDRTTNILTYPIDRLEGGQTNSVTIEGTVATSLPQTANLLCVVNQATAEQGRNTGTDSLSFCLQTTGSAQTQTTGPTPTGRQTGPQVGQTPNVSTSPKTGPELLALIGLIPAGISGLYLRRKTT